MAPAKKKFKWWILILCIVLLAIILFLAACIAPYFAHRGKVGPDVYYAFNQNTGTVIVYGKGCTYAYSPIINFDGNLTEEDEITYTYEDGRVHTQTCEAFMNRSPLMLEAENAALRKVIVLPGVTGLDSGFLRECFDLETVYLPDTMEYFSVYAMFRSGPLGEEINSITIYFDGDAPYVDDYNAEMGTSYPPIFGWYDVTIVHRPDAAGWDDPQWTSEDAATFYETIESRNFHINWLPLF